MKLNKVLALALSGVMAVSMLAGCSNNSGNGGQNGEGEQVPATGIVAVTNEEQKDNKVNVPFEYSTELEDDLTLAVQVKGQAATGDDIAAQLSTIMNVTNNGFSGLSGTSSNHATWVGTTTAIRVVKVDGNVIESVAMKNAAKNVSADLKNLIAEYKVGDIVYKYGFDGDVAMISVDTVDGGVLYYVAYVVTCNTTKALAD